MRMMHGLNNVQLKCWLLFFVQVTVAFTEGVYRGQSSYASQSSQETATPSFDEIPEDYQDLTEN